MRIIGQIFFLNSKFNPERLLVFKALRVGLRVNHLSPVHWSNTSHAWPIHVCNSEQFLVFKGLPSWSTRLFRVPKRGQSMYAIRNNSLFLGLFQVHIYTYIHINMDIVTTKPNRPSEKGGDYHCKFSGFLRTRF